MQPAYLLEAIVAYLSADTQLGVMAPGGVTADEADLDARMPYIVLIEPEGDYDNESAGASVETIRLQVSIFGQKAPARRIREYVKRILQDAPLTFTSGTLLHLRAADRTGMKDPDRGPGGADVWQEIQFFDAVVGHG